MEAASNFLMYGIDGFPFKFLGVRARDSPRNISMWRDLITQVKNNLIVWKGSKISFAGRIVLINSVLNAVPVYSLFFYKAHIKILQQIRQIQSNFLWHGKEDKRYIQ